MCARHVAAFAACALGCLTVAGAAQAAAIAVDIEADTVAADNHCSLREAITSANDDVPPFMVAGECAAGAVSDVVTLPTGHFVLSRTGPPDNTNVNGDLDVLGAGLTIRGQGPGSTTIDANRIDRALDVLAGRIATVELLTVTGGQAPRGANGGDVTGPAEMQGVGGNGVPGEPGGGIRNAGTLTITDSTIFDNRAGDGGDGGNGHGGDGTTAATGTNGGFGGGGSGAFFSGGDGGGIFTSGALTLTRVSVTGNRAGKGGRGGTATGGQGGGGISGNGGHGGGGSGGNGGRGGSGGGIAAASGATLTIDQSTISTNTAGDGGAGGLSQGGAGGVTSGDGTVGGNGGFGNLGSAEGGTGGFGGGIFAADPIMVTRSAVTGNKAGAGADGGNGTGGLGGHGIPTGSNSATGGRGGSSVGGDGGDAGLGGGVYAGGSFVNVTIQGNDIGDGGAGGNGKGGNGGVSTGGPTGGDGGNASAGDGGSGGTGGALLVSELNSTIRHATITANGVGTGGAAGSATGGNGGSPGGSPGPTSTGQPGFSGGIGGIIPSSATLANSVVAGNAGLDCGSGTVDGGHNFTFPAASCPGTVADPLLGPLADNGGPSRTQALLPGSPLIDAVPAGDNCTGTDQRGIVRPQGPACDVGAYEVEVPAPPGGGPPADTEPPVFLAASLKPRTFAVNRRGARETPVAARAHKGTTFRFRLSEAARVVFTIQRARPGRRVKGRCVKPKRSNRRRPKCTRFVAARRFAVTAAAGDNTKKFSGRIGRRALKPGRYRATLRATDVAGNSSKPKRLKFRVVRR
jgi:CSLREA domain-containing protein